MKSMQPMMSRHNNIQQHNTTGFARRALLLLTFLVASVGSVWGEPQELPLDQGWHVWLNANDVPEAFKSSGITIRAYVEPPSWNLSLPVGVTIATTWNEALFIDGKSSFTQSDPEFKDGYFEFELTPSFALLASEHGLKVEAATNITLTRATWEESDITDAPKPPIELDISAPIYKKEIDVSGVIYDFSLMEQASLIKEVVGGNITYVRWFIADSEDNPVYCEDWNFEQGLSPWNDNNCPGNKDNTNGFIIRNISVDLGSEYSRRENLLNITITAPDGINIAGMKVVAAFSSEPNSAPTEPTIQAICVFEFMAEDVFSGKEKTTCDATGLYITKYIEPSETFKELENDKIALATAKLPDGKRAKYARFYLLHDGEPVNLKNNSPLTVEGIKNSSGETIAGQPPARPTYGYYFYDNGQELDLSGARMTLTVEAGTFPEYEIVCVLSTDAPDAVSGTEVITEPDWDVVFTYAFRNQVETKNQTGTVEWDAVAMTATIPTDDMAEKWGTSWSNLAQEQKIQWYVTDGSDNQQPLVFGTKRQSDTWTINLIEPFVVENNIAMLTGQTTYNAASFESMWETWGNPVIYAPANKNFADVQNYKIICKIADDAEDRALPNVIYTFSLTNTFPGQEKTTIVKDTKQAKADANASSAIINFTLPEGTKYARFYIVDQSGATVNSGVWLTVEGNNQTNNADAPGWYVYNASGLTLNKIEIGSSSANLDEYQVVMITSSETAVAAGSTVTYEPDYENQTTFWLNYPATLWETSGNVEWSPQSMQTVAPDIEGTDAQKGEGYLDKNKQHYTLQWTIVDERGTAQPVRIGDSRVDDEWSINVSNNPFMVEGSVVTVSNNSDLCLAAWNKWVAPQIYAPKNMTMKQIIDKGIKFVCKLYESDEVPDDDMLAMTYTVYIDRKEVLGQLKDGGLYSEELVTGIEHDAKTHNLNLGNAITAYHEKFDDKKVTYVRVYLTKNDGTALDPTDGDEQFVVDGYSNDPHIFENHKEYGYYFQIEKDINLNAQAYITLPDAGIFTYYNVVVAMSGDTDASKHTEGMGSLFQQQRTASVMNAYEPDFDYIYTYKFSETSPFPGSLDNLQHNHSKEVLVKTNETQVLIPLNDKNTVDEFVKELGETSFEDMVKKYFHVRWFVAKKNPDGTYEKLPGSENMLSAVTDGTELWKEDNQGVYWNSELSNDTNPYADKVLKVNFTKPTDGNWSDYQVVVWMTNDSEGSEKKEQGTTLSKAPQNIKIQYIYNFFEEENWKFVHYKGASGRDYVTANAENPNYRDSRIDAVGSPVTQYDWDNATSTAVATTEDIRQSVHTVEYELYVGDEEVELSLPFQEGNSLEPTAYIRWYDYTTDLNTSMLDPKGTQLHSFEESLPDGNKQDRGWFHLDTESSLEHASNSNSTAIGMKFDGSKLCENETAVIACDVSKYYDGSYQTASDGNFTLLHEPTLGIRYIFTIRRAKVCADAVKEKADVFEEAIQGLKDGTIKYSKVKNTMFDLFENNGRTVVSLNETPTKILGEFSLRTSLSALSHYYIYNGSSTAKCDGIDWNAYYEDDEGLWSCSFNQSETTRIYNASYSSFTQYHTYTLLSDNSKTKKDLDNTADGRKFHLIGYLKSGNTKAAAIHYELNFINAPVIPISDLRNAKETDDDYDFYFKRTRDYLDEKLLPAGAVTFDDKFLKEDGSINYNKPTTWEENIREMPLEWSEAEYSFCYPSIDAYRQYNGWTGFTPQHGDYLLLKSMKLAGVSDNEQINYAWVRHWYYLEDTTLRDYTYTYKHGDGEADSDYGGFFYVDASDEARTVANLKFSASLCRGSEIHFTMAVANVTETLTNHCPPQLVAHVYEMTDDGKKGQLVMSFIACTLNDDIIKGENELAKWYQYYGYGAIPSHIELDGSNKNFIVEIDNNSKNTWGADFCVDEIRFYTKTTKLIVEQGIYDCNETEEPPTNLYVKVEDMQSFLAIANNSERDGKTIYWRICDKDHNPVPENEAGTLYENDKKNFGKVRMSNEIPDVSNLPYDHPNGEWGFFRKKDKDGKDVVYFSLAYKRLNLEDGKRYYISVYNLAEIYEPTDDDALWGIYTNACDVYSEFFLPRKMYVTVTNGEGEDNSEVTLGCGVSSTKVDINVVLHVPDNTQASGFKSYTFEFDFFLGTLEEFNSYSTEATIEGEQKTITLLDAIKDFRVKYPKAQTLPDDYDVEGPYRGLITEASGKLLLLASNKVGNLNVSGDNNTILAIPTQWYVTVTDKNGYPRPKKDGKNGEYETVDICDPFEFTFTIISGEGGGPELTLGFEGVDYTDRGIRVVRVGLKQIKNMQKESGYLLHIPVNTFKTDENAEAETGTLKIVSPYLELWKDSQTDDLKVTQKMNVATFEGDEVSENRMYVSVNFHGQGIDSQTFYEGFTYHMFFQVQDKDAGAGACTGEVHFLMKVVPEFVTWNGGSSQWNNDGNWNRSTRAELYKEKAGTGATQNTATDGHPDGYKDNDDLGISGTKAFVPMKFTYVTIPELSSLTNAPKLVNLEISDETDTKGIYKDMGDGATGNIQYDLMVRYTEKTCVDHGLPATTPVYDCERFYGNWAKEIYFKPEAELMYQQYLTYEKVWVEKELTAGTWYLMSTPLQNTYAGDMYVPAIPIMDYSLETPIEVTGQQVTEAFQPINFGDKVTKDDKKVNLYSRTTYPIYQKSWLQEGSKVYTMTNDIRKTDYSANLVGSVSETFNLWSHTYNDVQVNYSQWKGFAIRAHKSDYSGTRNNALLRLPKEDTNYDYYKWDGTSQEPAAETTENSVKKVTKETTGKLFTDGTNNISRVTYGVDYIKKDTRTAGTGTVNVKIGEVQDAKNYPNNIADYYLLIGNPYLCSINMEKFLEENENILDNAYWTYEHNTTNGSIKPLQAFFVKLKANTTNGNTEIKFTPAMMMDGNNSSAPSRTFTLTVTNGRGQSTASVSVGEEARSIETLFDSNLADVPMVYTVANGQAVSINQVTELDRPIAFGVTCAATDKPVAVTFSDIEQLTSGEVYVVDAVTGEQTAIAEGSTITVQPNDYGRYFLLAGALNIDGSVNVQQGIMVSVRDRMVTVTSGEVLTLVRATLLDGTTAYQYTGGDTTASFTLTPGVYIIHAENAAGERQTVKVLIKTE